MRLNKPKVAIITSFPRAQRVHVYNEMARLDEINFRVFYLRKMTYGRHWTYGPAIEHDAVFIPEIRLQPYLYLSPGILRAYRAYSPDLMIMTQYAALGMQTVMYHDSILNHPWVFWSEYPGMLVPYEPIFKNDKLRNMGRSLALIPVKFFPKEIWAIGTKAGNAYKKIVSNKIPVKNLPYFADLDRFIEVGEKRKKHPRVQFLFCGNLHVVKGADIVAKAISALIGAEITNFEIHIVGTGPLIEQFDNLAKKWGQILHLYGFLQLNDVPDVFQHTDVLLFPSRYDGWGMTLPEAMAAGMPVISTAQTGSAIDMIVDGENGCMMAALNTEQLTFYMRRFIEEPKIIRKMGEKARETAKQYTHSIGARTFLDMIHNVI